MNPIRYRVRHATVYRYSELVSVSHNVVRLAPADSGGQRCLRHELTVSPTPAVSAAREDAFGNRVGSFTVQEAHTELTVRAVSEVEVRAATMPPTTPAWEAVRDRVRAARDPAALAASEFRFDSPLVPTGPEAAAYAAPSFTPGRPLGAALIDLNRRINHDFAYASGATSIATPIAEVLRERKGVCQDFAQVMIACLRSLGLSARYISGYLDTGRSEKSGDKLVGADASHAWVAAFCPGADGDWLHLDPTNDCIASDRHIVVAAGRDFSDVSPIKGIIFGGGPHTISVAVEVVRIVGN